MPTTTTPKRKRAKKGPQNAAARRVLPAAGTVRKLRKPSQRDLVATFGRKLTDGHKLVPTDLGCPGCRGVLYVEELGKRGWLSFRCRIGHAYSSDSLLAAKEEQLEESLWSSFEVLDEVIQLYTALNAREPVAPRSTARATIQQRLVRAKRHRGWLHRVIEDEGPAPASIETRRRHRNDP